MEKVFISWERYLESIKKIELDLKKLNKGYDLVIGLSRGGMIPGVILSHRLNVSKVYSFGIRSYDEAKEQKDFEIYQEFHFKNYKHERILVCDDLVDKEKTLRHTKSILEEMAPNAEIDYVTIFTKSMIPDFLTTYGESFKQTDWVVFPYDQD